MGAAARHPLLIPAFPLMSLLVAAAAVAAAAGVAVAAVGGLTAAVAEVATALGLDVLIDSFSAGTGPRILTP